MYASRKARENANERAEELESILEKEYPTFVKPMLQSHVTGGFWLVSFIDVMIWNLMPVCYIIEIGILCRGCHVGSAKLTFLRTMR